MNALLARVAVLLCLAPVLLPAARNLELFFIDVEGGQATLIVSPSGESLLVDAGWPGYEGRDANRIMTVAKKAGVKRIDYLLVTHFHSDHVGGVPQLAEKFPIVSFVDHGDSIETGRNAERLSSEYKRVVEKAKRLTLKPGDVLPMKGLDIRIVSAHGAVLNQPLPGAGAPNALCASAEKRDDDPSENARSLGFVLSYRDKFRFVDLGDLTWNKELELVCPNNNIGNVDLYLVTHHGTATSNPSTIVHALKPRVAVMNNGARKGGAPAVWKVFRQSPGLEDLWQLHFAVAGGTETNVPDVFIANLEERCQGNYIQVSVTPSGEFTVFNSRNRYKKTYKAR